MLFWAIAKFKAAASWAGVSPGLLKAWCDDRLACWLDVLGCWGSSSMPSSSKSAPRDLASQPALFDLRLWLPPGTRDSETEFITRLAASTRAGCFSTRTWTILGSARCKRSSQSWSIERAISSSASPGTVSTRVWMLSGLAQFWRVCRKLGFVTAALNAKNNWCCSTAFSFLACIFSTVSKS